MCGYYISFVTRGDSLENAVILPNMVTEVSPSTLGIITTLEVDPTITLFMLIFTTTTVMQVVLGMGTTASGMGITITTAGTGTALGRWLVLP